MNFIFPHLKCFSGEDNPFDGESVFWAAKKHKPETVEVISKAKRKNYFYIKTSHGIQAESKDRLYRINNTKDIECGSRVVIAADVVERNDGVIKVSIIDTIFFQEKFIWILESDVMLQTKSRLLEEIEDTQNDLNLLKEADEFK